jgi:hypothetical protein
MDAEQIASWKKAALRPELNAPVATHRLDQILAAAREAGLSEREQGVLILTMTMGDLERQLRANGKRMPIEKKLAIAGAMSMRLLQSA